MNVNDLAALAERPVSEVAPWLQPIAAAMDEFQIDSAARQAAFLAQIVHESDGLGRVVENLSYSAPPAWSRSGRTTSTCHPMIRTAGTTLPSTNTGPNRWPT